MATTWNITSDVSSLYLSSVLWISGSNFGSLKLWVALPNQNPVNPLMYRKVFLVFSPNNLWSLWQNWRHKVGKKFNICSKLKDSRFFGLDFGHWWIINYVSYQKIFHFINLIQNNFALQPKVYSNDLLEKMFDSEVKLDLLLPCLKLKNI